jgi:signal transduction histidine kinase
MRAGKARILVVDDTDAARYAVVRALRFAGHEVIEALSGMAALGLVHREKPDLVVLDVHLPDILGFEVAERLRADEATRSIAILQVSASFTGAEAQVQGLERGADAYLTHPIESQVLVATVQALLRMRQAEQAAQNERARAEQALAERDKLVAELREESRRKNDFLAILSHELRNPLAPIINSVFILERANRDGDQAKRAREIIGRQVQHMTRLIDDLLDVTRIARGKVHLRREQVVLNDLVRRVVEDHRSLFKRAGIDLSVSGLEQPFLVNGDPTRLAQVMGNLLQNAAKFTPPGGKVTVSASEHGADEVLLSIRDTGAGISPDTLKHLFEPFVQGDKTLDRSSGGLGLGLALAKGIVDLHGGVIAAFSEGPGKGSELTVRLPTEERVEPEVPRTVEPRPSEGPCRVLIIEDHSDAAESLREALELSGHVVDVAQDGSEGIDMARARRPDAILCDIGLPLVDGYAVARLVREDPMLRDVLLVALSGYALQDDIDRSLEAGFDQHMAKPPRLDQLERLLSEAPRRAVTE